MKSINLLLNLLSLLTVIWFKIHTVEGIVGGKYVKPGQLPYHVSITGGGKHICNGAIINERNVLAVAHCFMNNHNKFEDLPYKILIGTVNIDGGEMRIEMDIEKIFIPRTFGVSVLDNVTDSYVDDLALIRTTSEMQLKEDSETNWAPMSWPQNPIRSVGIDWLPDVAGVVSGFGHTTPYRTPKSDAVMYVEACTECKRLKTIQAKVILSTECARRNRMTIGNHQLCAQAKQSRLLRSSGTCEGDSGSPLVVKGTVMGVLSSPTVTCNEKNFAAVYSKISYFGNFLRHAVSNVIRYEVLRVAEYVLTEDGRMSLTEVPIEQQTQ